MRKFREIRRFSGALLLTSMAVTMGLLAAEGRMEEAIPLHLCSLSALAAAKIAFKTDQSRLSFLWLAGMPGALLALLFPAPAVSRWQGLLKLSYVTTHALILLVPLLAFLMGERPKPGGEKSTFIIVYADALAAACVNKKLGTDFLFLSAPPAGTPLEALFQLGYPVYLLTLLGLVLLMITGMDKLGRRIFRE